MNGKRFVLKHRTLYRWAVDTSVYFIFWTLIGYIIQVVVVGITVTQYLSASFIGTIVTLLLVRVYTKFLDYVRYKLDTHFGYRRNSR